MKNLTPRIEAINTAVGVAFMRKIGAPQWQLMADANLRQFSEKTLDKMAGWVTEMQRAGKPVFVVLPRLEDGHWFLTARLPLTASPAALKPAPQVVVAADDFTALWRLAEPVTPARAQELVSAIVGKAGKPASGEPIPLPGTVLIKQQGIGLAQRFPVRRLDTSPSPGYRVLADKLVDVRQAPKAEKLDPRLMAVTLGDGAIWQPGAQSNGFFLMVGGSGAGKTETIKTVGAGVLKYGIPVLTFDFHGDVVVPGSKTILLASGSKSKHGINPLELYDASAEAQGLYDQRRAFCALVKRACPALGHKQENRLKTARDGAGLVFCATGNLSLRKGAFDALDNGAYVATVTSSDDELEIHDLHQDYRLRQVRDFVTSYSKGDRVFFLMNRGQAVNFIHGAAVGPFIYLIQAELIASLARLSSG